MTQSLCDEGHIYILGAPTVLDTSHIITVDETLSFTLALNSICEIHDEYLSSFDQGAGLFVIINQEAIIDNYYDDITVTQDATGSIIINQEALVFSGFKDAIQVSEGLSATRLFSQTLSHTVALTGHALSTHPNRRGICTEECYTGGYVTLTYGDLSVTLPAPNFGNSETYNYSTYKRLDTNGDTVTVRLFDKIILTEFRYEFTMYDVSALEAFLQATYGEVITIVTHTEDTITGVITVEPVSVYNIYNKASETYTVSLTAVGYIECP